MTDELDKDQSQDQPIEESGASEGGSPEENAAELTVESGDDPVAVQEDEAAEAESDGSDEAAAAAESPDVPDDQAEAEMLAMLEEMPDADSGAAPEDINFGSASVSDAQFQHLSEPSEKSEPRNIDLLMDVNLPVSIELGRTRMSISDILALGPGSVVELSKLAGEPVDVLVNFKTVARGEVVVIDENFGVRITQLMTAEERLRSIADEH